jgi:glutamate-1-semialdehyde 2,1-aminomutase
MVNRKKSADLFARASALIPGAVNSPVRAMNAVGMDPLFIERAAGSRIYDVDGSEFIDYVGSYGPAILGHCEPRVTAAIAQQSRKGLSFGAPTGLEVELARVVCGAIADADKLRLLSSGTEAAMTAIRIARAATGRPKIIKFDGCYHGHSDALLVRAGSGGMTLGVADSAGVPEAIAAMTRVADYNSIEAVGRYFEAEGREIAAVIVEPVAANMGVVLPKPEFLQGLVEIAHRHGALVISDEVITGFRLRFGVASEMLGFAPDLIMLGKIIGGGLPIGAVAGRRDLMDLLAPAGPVYQAGTLSGNPISVRAGLETLRILNEPGTYERLEAAGARIEAGMRAALGASGTPGCVNRVGSLVTMFVGIDRVENAADARRADTRKFGAFFRGLIDRGIYIPPSQFEAMFISLAHSDEDIDRTIGAFADSLAALAKEQPR